MRNIFFNSAFIFIALLFLSCDKKDKYAAEIKMLDTLQQKVNNASIDFKKIDTLMVAAKCDSIVSQLTFIQNNYKDTMTKETAIFLEEYRSIKKSLDAFMKEVKGTLEEIEYSEKQRNSLVRDLQNNLQEEEKAKKYFNDEKFAMEQLIQKMNDMSKFANENIEKYEELYPKVKKEMNKLQNTISTNNE